MKVLPSNRVPILLTAILLLAMAVGYASKQEPAPFENPWAKGRFALLQALALPVESTPLKPDSALVDLGYRLFYDTTLNPHTGLACVSCHQPEKAFSDGLKHPKNNPLRRNAPSLIGAGERRWQYWDGRKDSLWSQSLEPLLAVHEIALTPEQLLGKISNTPLYRELFESAFGAWPDPVPPADSAAGMKLQARIGLAFEAFVSELDYQPSAYDRYIHALQQQDSFEANLWLDSDQLAGIELLLRGNCLSCHRGSRFSDDKFHNIGTGESDKGRAMGKQRWQADGFNCESDAARAIGRACEKGSESEAEIIRLLNGAFKTPSLRELAHTAPYMHDGRFDTLAQVIDHYRQPPDSSHGLHTMPAISDAEAAQLVAFLQALSSPINSELWYNKPPLE